MISRLTSLQRLADIVDKLVDERVGVIESVIEAERKYGAPDIFCFVARACNTKALGGVRNFSDAGGASTDRTIALAKAIGEAVERYCAAIYDATDLPFCSYDDAPFCCVPPFRFALYSSEQYQADGFPYRPFSNQTLVRWTPAVTLSNSERCYVPASMVFLPYYYRPESGEPPIAQPISTGLACHSSLEEAAIAGICEVIERDAVMITWQAKLAVPHIIVDSLSERNRDLINRFEQARFSVSLFDVTMDHGISTILSILLGTVDELPALLMAAATHLDPEEAVRKSLEELALTQRAAQRLQRIMPPIRPDISFSNITSQDCHLRFFCDHNNVSLADFLFASQRWVDFHELPNLSTGDPVQDLQVLLQKISCLNHDILLSDITTPDIKELGLSVIRALIPGFHPLFFGHRLRALAGSRLWEVPQKLGYPGITRESGDNPVPHPYP